MALGQLTQSLLSNVFDADTTQALRRVGVRSCDDITCLTPRALKRILGNRYGAFKQALQVRASMPIEEVCAKDPADIFLETNLYSLLGSESLQPSVITGIISKAGPNAAQYLDLRTVSTLTRAEVAATIGDYYAGILEELLNERDMEFAQCSTES